MYVNPQNICGLLSQGLVRVASLMLTCRIKWPVKKPVS